MKKSGIEAEAVWTLVAILILLFFAVMSRIHGGGRRSDPVTGYTRGPVCPGDPVEEALSRYAIPSLRRTVSGIHHEGLSREPLVS